MDIKRYISSILTAVTVFSATAFIVPYATVSADRYPAVSILCEAGADVTDINPWGSGGQITLDLNGCTGYETITVVVRFTGNVTSASGWGFDTYTVNGNEVTATVSASGGNSWAFDGGVGIQVEGSDISGAELVSVTGSGTHSGSSSDPTSATTGGSADPTTAPSGSSSDPSASVTIPANAVDGDDWLTTDGSRIVDMNGNEVWLTGLSWFGYNTGSNLFDGVWGCNLRTAIEGIADHGFNLMRVPISAELLLQWKNGVYPDANYNHAYNPELESMNSLQIWDYVLDLCKANGIKVMLDIHSVRTDAMGHMAPLWYSSDFTVDQYLEALDWVARRYADNDTIIAYDLKNEPHGKPSETDHAIWNGSSDDNNWRYVAELAGNTILDANPHALIVIEGIEVYPMDPSSNDFISSSDDDYYFAWWGGNLRGVADYPVDFGSEARNRQIVYSPHDYGPAVYAQPWFEGGFTYQSLIDDYWEDSWLYIDEQDTAPLLIGEWGGFMSGDNLTWMEYMRQLIAEHTLSHTFWCYNANSGDTGGLILDDFTTWDAQKYEFVREVLWQTEDGSFIGLDHEVPLGDNGICLSDYTGDHVTPVSVTPSADPSDPSASSDDASANDPAAPSVNDPADPAATSANDPADPAGSPDGSDAASLTSGRDPLRTIIIGTVIILTAAAVIMGGILAYAMGSSKRRDN